MRKVEKLDQGRFWSILYDGNKRALEIRAWKMIFFGTIF